MSNTKIVSVMAGLLMLAFLVFVQVSGPGTGYKIVKWLFGKEEPKKEKTIDRHTDRW